MDASRDLSGRWIALAIIFITLAGAVGSVWYQHASTNATHEFLGVGGMALVTQSPQAELLILGQPGEAGVVVAKPLTHSGSTLKIGGHELPIVRRHDLNKARGVLNLRHALRQDASYDFDAPVSLDPPWKFAIVFADDARAITLAFDPDAGGRGRVAAVETGRVAGLAEKTASGLATFFADFEPGNTR
jgi:hypothetical protein